MADGSNNSENQPVGRLGIGRGKPLAKSDEEVPLPTTTSNSGWTGGSSGWGDAASKWDQSGQKGFSNDNSNGSGFRGQRDEFSGPRGGRGGDGGGGDSRSCYNCNQTGHISRDCTQPRAERGDGGSHRGSYYRGGGGGGFSGDRGRGGGFGGGDRDRGGGFGERSRGGFQQDSNFRSSTQGEDGSLSVTVKNAWGQTERSTFSTGQGNNSSFSSGGRNLTFENTNQQNAPSSRPSGFTSRGSGSNSDHRTDNSNFGERKPHTDSHDADEGDRPRPTERYIPAAAPTTEDEIFGEAVARGVNIHKYHNAHVQCTPEGKVSPIEIYEEANLPTQVLTNIRRADFAEPTAIQRYTIPCIQQKHDLMACAQTGAGKTAAFLLPIISNLLQYHQNDLEMERNPPAPLCLVLSPTRELALQTRNEAQKFAFHTPIKACSAIGGQDMFATSDRMKDGCHILSATTGRLKDMVEKGRIDLSHVKYLVLDEADRMLHHDFEPDIVKLMELGLRDKAERFTSMFSATFPQEVQRLAKRFLRDDYVFLAVGAIGGANEDITQSIEEVSMSRKKDRLFELLTANLKDERCLIFVETKRSADYLGTLLSQRNFMSTTMHGDRTQQQREAAVKQFTHGQCPILVATSVAARGLDFPLIGYVINYDLPDSSDFYIHRIGRTGRAGHLGKSISFFDPERQSDRQIAPDLVQRLSEAGQDVPEFLRRYGDGNATTGQQYNQSTRERNVDMRAHGGPSRGGRGGGTPNAWGSRGGTSSAGAAQDEQWD